MLLCALALGTGVAAGAEPPRHMDALPPAPSVEERLVEIQRRIQRAVVYPPMARAQGIEGIALLQFEIRHDGEPAAVEVAHSSGHSILDRAAERSVHLAAPLPWVYGRIEVPVRFALERR
jgi:protein TonB